MLRGVFLGPRIDAQVTLFGLPGQAVVLALAIVGGVVGLIWMRRLRTIEPEVHSFRATSAPARRGQVLIAVGLIATAILLAVIALGAIRLG